MIIKSAYSPRPVRFIELYEINSWRIKIYSISLKAETVSERTIKHAKKNIIEWLKKTENCNLPTYKIATLILHEGKEGCFAIINWWIDENMLQLFVYLASTENPDGFKLFSNNGIITCVWELEILWFERNAWIKHVLSKHENPDIKNYLLEKLNKD